MSAMLRSASDTSSVTSSPAHAAAATAASPAHGADSEPSGQSQVHNQYASLLHGVLYQIFCSFHNQDDNPLDSILSNCYPKKSNSMFL